jgi:cytochrome c553
LCLDLETSNEFIASTLAFGDGGVNSKGPEKDQARWGILPQINGGRYYDDMQNLSRMLTGLALAIGISASLTAAAATHLDSANPDWTSNALVPPGGRANIFNDAPADFLKFKEQGQIHAQIYPVSVTGILPPYEPLRKLAEDDGQNPLAEFFENIFRDVVGVKNFDSVMAYIGLKNYPAESDTGVYQVPYPGGLRPHTRLGVGVIERDGAKGFTFSCAACHSGNLFGKTVLGMTNRFPRANEFFVKIKPVLSAVDLGLFKYWTGATDAEVALLDQSRRSLAHVAARTPIQLGLDTSLAQVALSLNQREKDGVATTSSWLETFPRSDAYLDDHPADSKPAVWWNVKYKNRWLSDGSVLTGNPIFTNIIWNELGRGVDLKVLETWLAENPKAIRELTTAVFSSEAPKLTDFFPAEKIDLAKAKEGEGLFNQSCAGCHGQYEKGWNAADAMKLNRSQLVATTLVRPPVKTFVVDVGTDANRRLGMKSLEQLNDLSISKKNHIVIQAQKGYVPPPLVGIWARWPYFHNNSVPSLCAVLTRGSKRPKVYYAGEANDKERDFDLQCNGYPSGSKVPREWKSKEYRYDTSREGLSNRGHDEGIFLKDGKEKFTPEQKMAIVQFLQTL